MGVIDLAVERLTLRAAEGKSVDEQVDAYERLCAALVPLKSAIDAINNPTTNDDDEQANDILAAALASFTAQGA